MPGMYAILRRPMRWLAVSLVCIVLPAAAACGSTAPEPAAAPDNVVINLPIANRAVALTREDLRVAQGDTVTLNITADEAGEVHLHGYNLTVPVSPETPGALTFEADAAGAFGLNFHVFAADGDDAAGNSHGGHDHNGGTSPELIASAAPVSVRISADVEDNGGVNVRIMADGWRWAPELVDQEHTPGAGHGHIYVDGEKIARVFGSDYHIGELTPGRHEIRVTLNTNNHGELTYNGQKVEAITTVNVPDVGQAHNEHGHGDNNQGGQAERAIIAEVRLGNLEVYP